MSKGAFMDGSKFSCGICIDDMWTYAGVLPPKSIIIPHLLSVRLPQGPFSMNFGKNPSTRGRARLSTVSLTEPSDAQKTELTKLFSKNLARHLRQNRVRFVRCWFQWNLFQPRIYSGKDQAYEFPLDNFVQTMNDEGIDIIAVIGNGYDRFLPAGLNINNLNEYLPRLSEASREIVSHYRGKISMWQLENEPDWWLEHFASDWRRGGIWFDRDAVDRILGELHGTVLEEDPGALTMINLEADTSGAFSRSYSRFCDVLGLDFYPNYTHADPINVSKLKDKVSEAKKSSGKQIMITETGYPSGPKLFGFDQKRQSEYIRAICEEVYSIDSVGALGIWRLSDPYWLSFPFQENSFGLINRQGMPKDAWFVYLDQVKRS
ncbi:MAG: hypothetical protein ACREBS_01480 [Nitrososphaerales archaeon]